MTEPVAPVAPVTPETPAAPAAPEAPWFGNVSEDLKGYIENKQWSGPEDVITGYRNLEKLTGVPADRMLKLPGEGAEQAEWDSVWSRLGRPDKPEGYGFEAKEGQDAALLEWAQTAFHELGLPKATAAALMQKYEELGTSILQNEETAYQERTAKEATDLKKEWGAAFEQNAGVAKSAAVRLGIDGATIDKLERVLGFSGTMKLFHDIGSRTGEGDFVGSGSGGNHTGIMTPSAARNRIAALRNDPAFVQRYTSHETGAMEEMKRLHEWAYPE